MSGPLAAPPVVMRGHHVGRIVGARDGRGLVDYPANGHGPLVARTTLHLDAGGGARAPARRPGGGRRDRGGGGRRRATRLHGAPKLVEAAAEAIERITGKSVPRGAPTPAPAGLTEEQRDLWVPEAPVDASRAPVWRRVHRAQCDPARQYQTGLCVSDHPLGPGFDRLPLHVRYDIYLRARALTPGTPDWELESWSWKQRRPAP